MTLTNLKGGKITYRKIRWRPGERACPFARISIIHYRFNLPDRSLPLVRLDLEFFGKRVFFLMSWCLKNTSLPQRKEVILSSSYHITLPDSVTGHPSALISPQHQVAFFQKISPYPLRNQQYASVLEICGQVPGPTRTSNYGGALEVILNH